MVKKKPSIMTVHLSKDRMNESYNKYQECVSSNDKHGCAKYFIQTLQEAMNVLDDSLFILDEAIRNFEQFPSHQREAFKQTAQKNLLNQFGFVVSIDDDLTTLH